MDDDRFWVKSLTLENFRCFEKTELGPFDPHFNLLVGANGTGKSSVLLALANLFRQLAANDDPHERIKLGRMDLNKVHVHKLAFFREKMFWQIFAEFRWKRDELISNVEFRLSKTHDARPRVTVTSDRTGLTSDSTGFLAKGFNTGPLALRTELLVLYDVRRQFKDTLESHEWALTGNRSLAFVNWSEAGVSIQAFREWLKNQTLLALQSEDRARRGIGEPAETPARSQITLLKGALAAALEGATHIEVDGELNDIVVEFKNAPTQQFSQMSDGQRALIGMVADIARRACLLNFDLFGAETLERTTGLVLIDEIDLHLHPKWQRQIVGALKRIFPKIQFFATTHSPQVIGEAQPHEVILLTADGRQKRPVQSFGMDSNWILECVMEAEGRDVEVAKEVRRLYDAIDDGKFEEARELMAKLRDQVGNFGDVEAAESYIWRVEHEADEAAE